MESARWLWGNRDIGRETQVLAWTQRHPLRSRDLMTLSRHYTKHFTGIGWALPLHSRLISAEALGMVPHKGH